MVLKNKARRWLGASVAAAAAVATLSLSIPAANAAGGAYTQSNTGGTWVRQAPGGATLVYVVNGTPAYIYCYTIGPWALGNYWTNMWFDASVPVGRVGTVGWISASMIPTNVQPRVPHC